MRPALLVAALLLLAGCAAPEESSVKTIVGAKLQPGGGQPGIEYSVVVIAGGKFRAVGPQAMVPVPKGSAITAGLGKIVEAPQGATIAAGQPANLILRDARSLAIEARMRDGEWTP